jgi:hypothetical protein
MDSLLTPLERNIKTYLTGAVSADLIEVLAKLSLVRPEDPYLFLATEFLKKSPKASSLHIVEAPHEEESDLLTAEPSAQSSFYGHTAFKADSKFGESISTSASISTRPSMHTLSVFSKK